MLCLRPIFQSFWIIIIMCLCNLHLCNIVQQTLKSYDQWKPRVTAATSTWKENCHRALPQIEMSSPFSLVERMHKHKSTVCPAPVFCHSKPMHHKQTERHTLYRLLLLAHHAADTWLATDHHHYWSTTEHMQSDNWKQRQTPRCSL